MNDLTNDAFVHRSALNFNVKIITGDVNCPGINWNTGRCQSCNDEFSVTIKMHFWLQWICSLSRRDYILDLIFCQNIIPLFIQVYNEVESSEHKIVVDALPICPSYNQPIQEARQ